MRCGFISRPDCYETDDEMITFCEGCPSWDYATDIMEYLADRYDIDMKDENGEWKSADDLLKEIKSVMN